MSDPRVAWAQRNPEKRAAIELRRNLRTRGVVVTREEAAALVARRGEPCPGCGQPAEHVDHCHTRGHIRGLLCRADNLILGHAHDDPERLRRLADYLEESA